MAIKAICTVVNVAAKAATVVNAGSTILEKLRQKEPLTTADKVNVVAQAVFACAQMADMAASCKCPNSEIHLKTNIAAGALDVTRTVTDKMATSPEERGSLLRVAMDVAAVAAFRAADSVDVGLKVHANSDWVRQNGAILKGAAEVVGTAVAVYRDRESLGKLGKGLLEGGQLIWSSLKQCWVLQPPPQTAVQPPSEPMQASHAISAVEQQFNAKQATAEQGYHQILQVPANWEDIQEVPEFLRCSDYPVCKMSDKLIRHIMIPAFDTDDLTLVFDRSSVEDWIANRPNEKPPGWPVHLKPLPIRPEYFVRSAFAQKDINVKLSKLVELMRQLAV
jgi:hypothetical protein